MAKEVHVFPLTPSADASPKERNKGLILWLSGNNKLDIRSITWVKETKEWIAVTVKEAT